MITLLFLIKKVYNIYAHIMRIMCFKRSIVQNRKTHDLFIHLKKTMFSYLELIDEVMSDITVDHCTHAMRQRLDINIYSSV
jgi:hypothetical protein